MKTILFQGDSITDGRRDRENDQYRGSGYATMVSAQLMCEQPGAFRCINRGVGGNRILDVYARIRCDIENMQPDVMSLLIGINDVWHETNFHNGVSQERFERVLDLLLSDLRTSLPQMKIMLLEPFVLHGKATCAIPENPGRWDYFREETPKRAAAVRAAAEKYSLPFIPLQQEFDRLAAATCAENWLIDGVHPTAAGHWMIAQKWLEAYRAM